MRRDFYTDEVIEDQSGVDSLTVSALYSRRRIRAVYTDILKGSGIYAIASIAGPLLGIALLPIYTRHLSPSDYGILELLDLTLVLFSVFAGGSLPLAIFYYFTEAPTEEERNKVISTALLGSFLLGAVGCTAGLLGSVALSNVVFQSPTFAPYFRLLFLGFAVTLPLETALAWLRTVNLQVPFVLVSVTRLVVSAATNIVCLTLLHLGLASMLWGTIVGATSLGLVVGGIGLRRSGFRFDLRLFYKLCRYALPTGLMGLAMFVVNFGDRYFLKRHVSLATLGTYGLAYRIGMLIAWVQTPFNSYWTARMYQIVRGPDGDRLYARVCTYYTLILSYCALLLVVFSGAAMNWLVGKAFWPAAALIPWIAGIYLIRAIAGYFRFALYLVGKPGLDAQLSWASALTCIAGYVVLIPRFGVAGAIAATGAAFVVLLIVSLWTAQRVRHFPLEINRLVKVVFIAFSLSCVFLITAPETAALRIAFGIVVAALYPLMLILARVPTKDESDTMAARLRDWCAMLVSHSKG